MLRLAANAVIVLLAGPVIAGLAFVMLPAFGHAPVLGQHGFNVSAFAALLETPALLRSVLLSLASGLATTVVALAIVLLFLAGSEATWLVRMLRRSVSPLLATPHAAMAFGLAFLIAPSGMLMRALSPWLTGLDEPPDLLIVNDPWALAMMGGLVLKEAPFLLLIESGSAAASPGRRAAGHCTHARLLAGDRLAQVSCTGALSADPSPRLCRHRLCLIRGRCRHDPGADQSASLERRYPALGERSRLAISARRQRRSAAPAWRDSPPRWRFGGSARPSSPAWRMHGSGVAAAARVTARSELWGFVAWPRLLFFRDWASLRSPYGRLPAIGGFQTSCRRD